MSKAEIKRLGPGEYLVRVPADCDESYDDIEFLTMLDVLDAIDQDKEDPNSPEAKRAKQQARELDAAFRKAKRF